eukprot:CAMPEP_0171095744 /NCGR_PEP_ID=MMETSP0766_2-20121228/43347_1 /TAXON_ID=439317 /ORGANISM="Gambierdiscus australes, Strain CAWD 149" /LENGTH=227 /DNA_ID=CAMNT_0011554595 /DNA_START=17 /DNA_END=700 /DNA_ORIENTATION=+
MAAVGGSLADLAAVITALLMVVLTVVGIFVTGTGGGLSAGQWFSWHPIFMTIAFPVLMMFGRFGILADEVRPSLQTWKEHRAFMVTVMIAVLLGYFCIFMAHLPQRRFFGHDFNTGEWADYRRVAHAWLGYLLIFSVLWQVFSGFRKYSALASGVTISPEHGTLGKAIIIVGGFNVVLAIRFWGWVPAYKVPMYAVTVLSVIFGVIWPPAEKKEEEEEPLLAQRAAA